MWETFITLPTLRSTPFISKGQNRTSFWTKRSWSYPRWKAKIWWIHFGESEKSKRNSWADSENLCYISWRFSVQKTIHYLCKTTSWIWTSNIVYGQVIWTPLLKKYITILENMQRRATKLVDGFCHMSYSERLKKLNLPSLAYR